mmetsp:Transcript_49707/g.108550  ORF Transcript_49707/g.108550 Transcript_49707/m.108550 type:complete len:104 (+) Transcript_49707:164-475(+)
MIATRVGTPRTCRVLHVVDLAKVLEAGGDAWQHRALAGSRSTCNVWSPQSVEFASSDEVAKRRSWGSNRNLSIASSVFARPGFACKGARFGRTFAAILVVGSC